MSFQLTIPPKNFGSPTRSAWLDLPTQAPQRNFNYSPVDVFLPSRAETEETPKPKEKLLPETRDSTLFEQVIIGDKAWTVPAHIIFFPISHTKKSYFPEDQKGNVHLGTYIAALFGYTIALAISPLYAAIHWIRIELKELFTGTTDYYGFRFSTNF